MGETGTKSVFLLLMILNLIVSSSSNRINFDIYQLVFQWAPATCSSTTLTRSCSVKPHDKFSIGGLWPTRSSPFQILGHCHGSLLVPENIRPVEFGLYQNWPDVISRNDQGLWREEWRKHGTCSEQYLNQLEYFSFAINSFTRHNFLQILRSYIRPQPFELPRSRSVVEETIHRQIGVRPLLYCNFNNLSKTTQLHAIHLCYSKDFKTLQNCPGTHSCPESFSWFQYMRTLYSYFQVSFQWQPATCFNNDHPQTPRCLRNPDIRFSIIGVWPTTYNGVRLGPCTGSNFDINKISTLRDRLNKAWPDLFSTSRNDRVWGSEWRNHGTCSEDQFGQQQYFSFGVHVHETFDILSILRRGNIIPNGQSYNRFTMESVISRVTGVRSMLLCNTRLVNNTNISQLHQIIICYDDYGRQRQDCQSIRLPEEVRRCPTSLYWFP